MFNYAVYVTGKITKCPVCRHRVHTHKTLKYKMLYCETCRRRYVTIDVYRRNKRDFRCMNPEALQKLIEEDIQAENSCENGKVKNKKRKVELPSRRDNLHKKEIRHIERPRENEKPQVRLSTSEKILNALQGNQHIKEDYLERYREAIVDVDREIVSRVIAVYIDI